MLKKLKKPTETFETYLQKWKTVQPEIPLTITELKDAFFSLKPIKALVTMELVLTLSRIVLDP